MHFTIDESINPVFMDFSQMSWKISLICGAILPSNRRKSWLKRHKTMKKGSEYKPGNITDESAICQVLDEMYKCRIKGVIVVGDIGHATKKEAEDLRQELIDPLYPFAAKEPKPRGDKLKNHLDNLLSKGTYSFSLQDFYKVWNILETITLFVKWYAENINSLRPNDLDKLILIIDDQAEAAQVTLKEFIHFFLFCRSREGIFCLPEGFDKDLPFLRVENDIKYLNANELFNKILVGKQGDNIDDKYPEVKIADFLANITRRTLNGEFPLKVAEKLKRLIKITDSFQASADIEKRVILPQNAKDNVNLLMPEHIL